MKIRQIAHFYNDKGDHLCTIDSDDFQPFTNEEEISDRLAKQIQQELDDEFLAERERENAKE